MRERDDPALARGRQLLADAGVDATATDAAALTPLAGRSAELDLALVERLGATPSDDNAAALARLAADAERRGWKAVVKASKRALYRFGQRGIATPEPAVIAEPSSIVRRVAAPALEGMLSPIDGRGDRLVWIVRPQREGGLLVLTAVLNEPAGLRDVAIADLARKTLRRMERDLQTRHGLTMVSADGAYCDALVAEGYERARAAGTEGVGEYPTYRARMTVSAPETLEPPLIARVVDLDAAPLAEGLRRGAALLGEPELATWIVEPATLAPYLEEIAGARESPLVLSRPQQEERAQAIITRAVRELFGDANAAVYRRRLEEMAYWFHASGRREPALAAVATARAVASSPHGGEGIPFFEELTRRSFALIFAQAAERAKVEAESSVLVRPGAPGSGRPPGRPPFR